MEIIKFTEIVRGLFNRELLVSVKNDIIRVSSTDNFYRKSTVNSVAVYRLDTFIARFFLDFIDRYSRWFTQTQWLDSTLIVHNVHLKLIKHADSGKDFTLKLDSITEEVLLKRFIMYITIGSFPTNLRLFIIPWPGSPKKLKNSA